MQASGYSPRSDTELLARAAAGDEPALAALYERHFEAIYDFVLRTLKDRDIATDAIRAAFIDLWHRARRRKAGNQVRAWIYAKTRERAVRAGRRRSAGDAGVPADSTDAPAFAQRGLSDVSHGEPELDAEVSRIVWEFAAQLSPKEYSLLDLHLRRGLKVDELAESLGLTTTKVYIILYRLRQALVEWASAALLSRRGRKQCSELDAVLAETRAAQESRDYRRSITKHLEVCSRCHASTATYPSALQTFADLAPLEPPPGVQAAIWTDVSDHINGISPYRTPRTLEPRDGMRRLKGVPFSPNVPVLAVLGAAIASIVAILVAGVLIFGTGGGGAATARDPDDVHSTDHKTGEPSSDNTIDLAWTPIPRAKGYSTMWSHLPNDLPDTVADLPGNATNTTSPPLDPGTWYFHLRTQNEDGTWTSTLHIGPFEVIATTSPTPNATEAPPPSPTQTVTPAPGPHFPTEPAATPTETPAPTPPPTPPPPTPAPSTPAPSLTLPALSATPTTAP